MAKASGKLGKVTAGGSDLHVTGWSHEESVSTDEVTDTGSAGWQEMASHIKKATGSCEAFLDVVAEPYGSPLSLEVGDTVALELFCGDPTNGDKFSYSAIITAMPVTSRINESIKYELQWESTGAITRTFVSV